MPESEQQVTQEIPEEALVEAAIVEHQKASQSDLAKLYDAVISLTKEIAELKSYNTEKWEETETFRRAGRF